jgi:lactate dehydrogenase-like 2-hydroxyacid dehydrogenase
MKLYINIGKNNNEQLCRIREVLNSNIVITETVDLDVDIMLITSWRDEYLQTKVKAIFVPYTGLNRFPVELLKARGIQILNTHAKANLVAERAFTLALSVRQNKYLSSGSIKGRALADKRRMGKRVLEKFTE